MTRIVGGAPGEDGCLGRRMVHLNDRRPVLSLIGRVAVIDVVIVTEHRVNVAGLVDAHVREIVIIADLIVGAVVHHVVGEALASISGNCHPDSVIGACTGLTASYLTRVVDTIEGLVDVVATGIDHQIPDLIVVDEEGMAGINGIAQLGECRSSIKTAVDIDVESRDIVIGDTDFGCPIGGNPFTVITRNGGTGWIECPGITFVCAGADIDIGQVQAGDVDVVITN